MSPFRLAVVPLLAAGVLAGCGTEPETTAATTSPSPSISATTPAAAPLSPTPVLTTSAAPTPSSSIQTINITVADGKVTGVPSRVKVAKGTKVALMVHSDIADEVHLHGYNESQDIEDGMAMLQFTADKTGVFEVELEKKGQRLTMIQVQ